MNGRIGEDLQRLCDYSKKVIEAKGWVFHKSSFIQGVREAEKFHNVMSPIGYKEEEKK